MDSTRAPKKVMRISHEHAANGGHILTHEYDNMNSGESWKPPIKHAFTGHAEMVAHFAKHTKGEPDADEKGGAKDGDRDDRMKAPTQTGTGHAKAAPPTAQSRGAGMD